MSPSGSGNLGGGVTGSIVKVTDKTAQDATGAWVPGETVTYQLSTGQMGSVWLPKSEATPEAVEAAVKADAKRLNSITGITF